MIILGLDPGLANTGWGVIESVRGRHRHLAHGAVVTPSTQPTGQRLNTIFQAIQVVIQRYQPHYAGIENLYFAKNETSAIPVAQARGILLLLLHQAGVVTGELTPVQIKQAVTGHGRSDKREVQTLVQILLGLNELPTPDHAADALAAALAFETHQAR